MSETRDEAGRTELRITEQEARHVADLLRYAVSLNTTVGLISPTQRRLATSTYKAVELAALVLEGKTFEEAVEEANNVWTGSLEEDHRRALELLQQKRDTLKEAMSGRLDPELLAEYLEVQENQFLELVRPNTAKKRSPEERKG
ncbi:MAG TPA: hypothetical protein VFV45_07835 [Rubrobacteraceae bacterium]|nr:hypothetical protein [Rubrobacteraceae bacterium]